VTSGATSALGNISMTGYDSTKLTSMVEKVTSGATGALGKISMTGYDAAALTGMMEKVTAGATGALGRISMTGYSSENLTGMMEKVTAGATGALGNISMTGYSSDNLSSMVAKVTAGATGALGNISMTGYTSADLTGMVTKITSGATGALGKISMTGYDSNDLSGMITKVTSGATGALGNISMAGYSSDNVTAFTSTITTSVTSSLSNITMTGYDPTNIPTDITNSVTTGASAGALVFLGSDNVTGTYSSIWGGATPSGGCIDNSTALSAYSSILPSGTVSFKNQNIITSSRSFTKKYSYYSDSSCSTKTGHIKYGHTNLIVNPVAVTGLSTGSSRPSSAYKVQYSKLNVISKGKTSTAVSFLNTFVGMTHSLDVEQTKPDSGTIYNIWATGTAGGVNLLFIGTEDETYPYTYPTDWGSYDETFFK